MVRMHNAICSNELRTDFLGRSVVLTPRRSKRPHDFKPTLPKKKTSPENCYFCPGNEHMTPPEIARIEENGNWVIRSFPNKFPAFTKGCIKAYGTHEIIVETPNHTKTLSQIGEKRMFQYLSMVATRLRAHAKDRKIKYTCVFKNEWEAAGASLEHSHTQLVAMNTVPDIIRKQERLARGVNPFATLAIDDKYPKISNSGPFVWISPYAPRFNYETWIVPRAEVKSIVDLDEQALKELGKMFLKALKVQDAHLGYPPYNVLFHLAPHRSKRFHFHIEICPRRSKWAGFELGSGIIMNSVKPEWTATEYRETMHELGL